MANGRSECVALTAARPERGGEGRGGRRREGEGGGGRRPEHAQAAYCSCERGSGIVKPRVTIIHNIMHDID